MNRIFNRRHVYQKTESLLDAVIIVEEIDAYLEYSNKLSLSRDEIVVYRGEDNLFLVGRELLGHEQSINLPEDLFIKDYAPCDIVTDSFSIQSEPEFLEITKKIVSLNFYRLRFTSFSELSVDFCKTEK